MPPTSRVALPHPLARSTWLGRLPRRVATLGAAVACIGGCGAQPSGRAKAPLPVGIPGVATPAPDGPNGGAPLAPEALLAAFRARLGAAKGLKTELQVASNGRWYGGKRTATERTSHSRSRMTWAPPARLRAEVLDSSTALLKGATMLWDGGGKVQVKAGGWLGLVPLSLALTDARLLTNRNHAFATNHPMAHLRRLAGAAASPATWRAAPARSEAPGATWVEVADVPRPDEGVGMELLALEASSLVPVAIVMLEGGRAVVTFRFSSFSWDPPVDGGTFRL